ncbi:DUF6504 family protein [Chloroflexota bacterium]
MSSQFIGQDIKVTVDGEVKAPVSFKLGKREYIIEEIIDYWPDHGFSKNDSGSKKWWQRRHRNYYHVKTTEGEVYEIYYDRGTSLKNPEYKKWFLTRKL